MILIMVTAQNGNGLRKRSELAQDEGSKLEMAILTALWYANPRKRLVYLRGFTRFVPISSSLCCLLGVHSTYTT